MPYIDSINRAKMDTLLRIYGGEAIPHTAGMLAYVVTKLTINFIKTDKCFTTMALALGVLLCVVLEVYRRWMAPFEDNKILNNGDVFDDGGK